MFYVFREVCMTTLRELDRTASELDRTAYDLDRTAYDLDPTACDLYYTVCDRLTLRVVRSSFLSAGCTSKI